MTHRLTKRRSHTRRLRSGNVVVVRESWVLQGLGGNKKKGSYRHSCPNCGAEIISVHMPNSGWAHFEGQPGLTRIKHPCMHVGETMRQCTDKLTLDLFEKENDFADL